MGRVGGPVTTTPNQHDQDNQPDYAYLEENDGLFDR